MTVPETGPEWSPAAIGAPSRKYSTPLVTGTVKEPSVSHAADWTTLGATGVTTCAQSVAAAIWTAQVLVPFSS